tara:strand:+ start:2450 stop:3190 length:741 start_codon:yes stop_codon:yes gene_type:complete
MTDYLPTCVMPPPPAAPAEEEEEEDINPETHESNENFIYSDEEIDPLPQPVKKEKLSQEEIFGAPQVPTVKKVVDPIDDTIDDLMLKSEEVKPKKVVTRRGRVMSEKQIEALNNARAKGLETRRRNSEAKKALKRQEQEDRELVQQVKTKARTRLKKKLEDPDMDEGEVKTKIIEKDRIIQTGYSQEQLDKAVSEAVEKSVNRVEVLRKERKKVKKAAQAKDQHDAKIFHEINSALKKDVWSECFM